MKIRLFAGFLGGALSMSILAGLAGCVSFAPDPIDCADTSSASKVEAINQVSIVIAPTDNFTAFEPLFDSLKPQIKKLLGDQPGEINVIVADGRPKNINKGTSDKFGENGKAVNKDLANASANAIYCIMPSQDVPVISPITMVAESDMIQALALAGVPFENNAQSQKHIFVIGNGIQTSGQYSFKEGGVPSEGSVASIVDKLKKSNSLPDLNGATVSWTGLGQVTGAQPALNEQSLKGLKAFWLSIIEASNGHVGTITGEGQTGVPAPSSIHVSPVKVLPKACVSASLTEKDGFDFKPGTATFRNLQAAQRGATLIASELKKNSNCQGSVTVTGFVASGVAKSKYVFGNSDDAALSRNRALAFKTLLVEAGVNVPIFAVGGGKGSEVDWRADGTFDDAKGQLNRKVTVTQQ